MPTSGIIPVCYYLHLYPYISVVIDFLYIPTFHKYRVLFHTASWLVNHLVLIQIDMIWIIIQTSKLVMYISGIKFRDDNTIINNINNKYLDLKPDIHIYIHSYRVSFHDLCRWCEKYICINQQKNNGNAIEYEIVPQLLGLVLRNKRSKML